MRPVLVSKAKEEADEEEQRRASGIAVIARRNMAKRTKHSFEKFQKERKRKKKAEEKLARRQGKKDKEIEAEKPEA